MLLKIRGVEVIESLKSRAIHAKFVIESSAIHHPKGATKDIMC